MSIHYFDHGTTSKPKASGVPEATEKFYREICASPSRSGLRLGSPTTGVLSIAWEIECGYFQARSPNHIVFISEATEALNLVIRSELRQGDEMDAGTFGQALDKKYDLLAPAVIHCARLKYDDLGTLPSGKVRISFGHRTMDEDVKVLVRALRNLESGKQ